MTEPQRVKMSVLAERTGVPVPTLKHYQREGLLPEPTRTSRNMAYYDVSLIHRVRAIRRLQSEMFLPLRVIRQVLDRHEDEAIPDDMALEATVARILAEQATKDTLSRRQALSSGLEEPELEALERMGLIALHGDHYRDDDAALLRSLAQARRAGITGERLPAAALQTYTDALSRFVRAEVEFFRAGVASEDGDRVNQLAETAATLSERMLVILRRKLLLPLLREQIYGPPKA